MPPRGPARVAIISGPGSSLPEQLQALALQPVVQSFTDLYGEAASLAAFAPRVLLLELDNAWREHRSAIRMLRSLIPDLDILVICGPDEMREVSEAMHAEVTVLEGPVPQTILTESIERILADPRNPGESYLQFVQGICDEINNPLLFATGHLQLLENQLDRTTHRSQIEQVAAIRRGLQRIDQTMKKVSNMSRAAAGDRRNETFAVGDLLAQAEGEIQPHGITLEVACSNEVRVLQLSGDLSLLAGALLSLARVGVALIDPSEQRIAFHVSAAPGSVEIHMQVDNARLQEWELPRAFEPYHLNRVLRGTSLGLDLFLVRIVCRAHGGDAIARRLSDTSVEFRIGLAIS